MIQSLKFNSLNSLFSASLSCASLGRLSSIFLKDLLYFHTFWRTFLCTLSYSGSPVLLVRPHPFYVLPPLLLVHIPHRHSIPVSISWKHFVRIPSIRPEKHHSVKDWLHLEQILNPYTAERRDALEKGNLE